jgi:hypothetical protein
MKKLQSQFNASTDNALKTAGHNFMDIVTETQAVQQANPDVNGVDGARAIASLNALEAACGQHGVNLQTADAQNPVPEPSFSDPSTEQPSPSPSGPPIASGDLGEPFIFHTDGGTPTTGGQATPTDVSITIKPLNCGFRYYTVPASDYEPEKTVNAPAGMRYCAAHLTVKNTSKEPVGKLLFNGRLTTTDATAYDQDDQATADLGGSIATADNPELQFNNETYSLNPGQTTKTAVVWAIPIGAEPAQLEIIEAQSIDESTGEPLSTVVNVDPRQVKWLRPLGK